MSTNENKKESRLQTGLQATNEFNQPLKGNSLYKDAWRRLKRNKMAIAGLIVVALYSLIALLAPVLPIYSYKEQQMSHIHLPPAFSETAGEQMLERKIVELTTLAAKDGRVEWTEEDQRLIEQTIEEARERYTNSSSAGGEELTRKEKDAIADAERAVRRARRDIAVEEGRVSLNEEEKAELEAMRRQIASETEVIDGKEVKVHERRYLFGTDYLGRDMLARTIWGGQMSIAIGLIGGITSVLLGLFFGAIAGYVGGKTDYIIMRVVDIMYSMPYMMLVIILMALFGRSIILMFLALSLVSWLTVARVVRGQIISLKNSEYVEAARSMGASSTRIIFRHLVPNTFGIIIVYTTLRIPVFIQMEAFLSFLGLGISAPYASWGSLIGDAVEGMRAYPWRLFFPAAAMTIFLFAMNFLGDGLRDAFDPQSKNKL
ncbi:MAG: ABC transporter permease [Spirochaetaceae bacterium]|nr:ABC transporter permease [Spirochaetaceae bacterium]MCF7947583.1 ABC transporter permease [Spirochaetia bacterium]MCF7952270.1 ABC transporter permease [Spirochaetaceae bacterium]